MPRQATLAASVVWAPGRSSVNNMGGRVGFFRTVDDFDATCERISMAGVVFVTAPRDEPYGRIAVFLDIAGDRWDLLGPARRS